MYQTFSGSSRRHRQVNLSGRPSNPFAKGDAVASAQQDRINRQIQRDRLQASSRIQRVWRGHTARRKAFKIWREVWDHSEETANGAYSESDESLKQLRRLMLFFSPRHEPHDVQRLAWYGTRQITTSETVPCTGEPWLAAYSKLQRACIAGLKARKQPDADTDRNLLGILAFAARQTNFASRKEAVEYYDAVTSVKNLPAAPLQASLLAPLKRSAQVAYCGLVVLLEKPLDLDLLGLLKEAVDPNILSQTILGEQTKSTRERLWLLGNMIFLAGQTSNNMSFTAAVGRLLGLLADDVDFETQSLDMDNVTFDQNVLSKVSSGGIPLNTFLHRQVVSLLDQHAIRNLLSTSQQRLNNSYDAQNLAGYALTLLRCFPLRSDEIRMWLHLGPSTEDSASPTGYLWNAAKTCKVFGEIRSASRAQLLKTPTPSPQQKDNWTIILVFLEMFTFDLKIMDDEEFMGSSSLAARRNSAVPIADVAQLVTFLKNLGFTMYFNAPTAEDTAPTTHVGDDRASNPGRKFGRNATESTQAESKSLTIAGLPGLTIDYLKGLVTGLLRAIYERDSRRNFLPRNHWLMTGLFNMETFMSNVVAQEEYRHTIQEQDDEDRDVDSDDNDDLQPPNGTSRVGSGYARVLRTQEARARAQRKASRKKFLEAMIPHLEILQNMPFFIPFHTRVEIFREFVHHDQETRRNGHVDPDLWRQNMMFQTHQGGRPGGILARHTARIKRTQEFMDAYEQFYDLGADLKEPIQITFVDQFDMQEAGIDGGGVTKEFLTSVIGQAFDQKAEHHQPFFVENEQHLLYPNPTAFEDRQVRMKEMGFRADSLEMRNQARELYKQYEFLGRIIGKCLYEGILVDVSFAGFFLKKWALTGGTGSAPNESHYRPNINDLRELDESLYRNLLFLKNTDHAEDLGLTFSVNVEVGSSSHKEVIEVDLAPNGANTPVTNENRLSYINRMASYKLQLQSRRQTNAFLRGLGDIIQPSWLSMFNQTELQTLIGGAAHGIDVRDLRNNTQYGGLYAIGDDGLEHPSVQLFWDVMQDMKDEDRRKVLKFVTSTPRGPLLGFGHLNPKFSIRDSGRDENRLPSTSTCVNLLKLPIYKSERVLRQKLLEAVNSGAGFDLS